MVICKNFVVYIKAERFLSVAIVYPSYSPAFLQKSNKKALNRSLSRTNTTIRGATLIHANACAYRIRKYPGQLTDAHPLQNTQQFPAFDCTLRGPFAERCRIRISAARTLCAVLFRRYLRINGLMLPF